MNNQRSRSGFTLIEMLLVLGIIVILATILIPISLRAQDNNLVARGADQVQGGLVQARSRAAYILRSQGVRFTSSNLDRIRINLGNPGLPNLNNAGAAINANYMAWYDKMEFVEDPGDFTEGWVWGIPTPPPVATDPGPPPPGQRGVAQPNFGGNNPIPGQLATAAPVNRQYIYIPTPGGYNPRVNVAPLPFAYRIFGPLDGLAAARTPVGRRGFNFVNHVQVGDRIELYGNGQVYEILAVLPAVGNLPSSLIVDRPLPYDIPIPTNSRPNYRIIRQPRPISTLKPIQLPQEVVIEFINRYRNPINKNYPLNPAVDHDIPALQEQNPNLPANPNAGLPDLNARNPSNQIWMRGVSNIKVIPGAQVDIMFSPAGQVVNLPQGIVHLWLHRYSNPAAWFTRSLTAADYRPENQALVSIYARTGTISTYRVNQTVLQPLSLTNSRNWPWFDSLNGHAQGVGGL